MKKFILTICILFFCTTVPVYAAETPSAAKISNVPKNSIDSGTTNKTEIPSETEEQLFSLFDFSEMEDFISDIFPDEKMGFIDIVKGLISGEIEFTGEFLWDLVSKQFFYEFKNTKSALVHVLAIVIIAAVFRNFSGVFQNNQISEMCFYVLYMLLITICLNSFRILIASAVSGLTSLMEFLKLLSPVYFMAVALSTGSVTSIAFYNMILILICIVELVIQSFLIPLVQVYMVIRVLNELSTEEYLSKFGELLHTVIVWVLRTMLGAVIGINLIQGLLAPAIDSVKRSVLLRGGEAIPIIGDVIGGASEVVLGTTVLIKNGIGVAGAIICIAICMAPVVQMAVVTLMYKLTAALIQPISEKRIVGCVSSMADGAEVLLRVIFTSGVLFLITIAMVANTTT